MFSNWTQKIDLNHTLGNEEKTTETEGKAKEKSDDFSKNKTDGEATQSQETKKINSDKEGIDEHQHGA